MGKGGQEVWVWAADTEVGHYTDGQCLEGQTDGKKKGWMDGEVVSRKSLSGSGQ